tara:strand:+ start:323 stop:481 length:159 start_codon:yes stop_codon:yes gene_type:complete
MIKYQLVYNGNACYPLVNTREEAENFKQKAAKQFPEIIVEIKAIELQGVKSC